MKILRSFLLSIRVPKYLINSIYVASGKTRKGGRKVEVTETFHCDPVGSTPIRQRFASQPEASLAGAVATSLLKRGQRALKTAVVHTLEPSRPCSFDRQRAGPSYRVHPGDIRSTGPRLP
jgi:hypothetical protein